MEDFTDFTINWTNCDGERKFFVKCCIGDCKFRTKSVLEKNGVWAAVQYDLHARWDHPGHFSLRPTLVKGKDSCITVKDIHGNSIDIMPMSDTGIVYDPNEKENTEAEVSETLFTDQDDKTPTGRDEILFKEWSKDEIEAMNYNVTVTKEGVCYICAKLSVLDNSIKSFNCCNICSRTL